MQIYEFIKIVTINLNWLMDYFRDNINFAKKKENSTIQTIDYGKRHCYF